MNSRVADYFPNAPEECLQCPGLLHAAYELEACYEVAVNADERMLGMTTEHPGITDPAVVDATMQYAAIATEVATDRHARVSALAEELYGKCRIGARVEERTARKWGRTITEVATVHCNSTSPLSALIPPVERPNPNHKP